MSSIQKIADMMDDDGPLNEIAVTTSAIPIAPLGGSGLKSSTKKKKKNKKKEKKKSWSTTTGQPLKGDILFSGVEDEEHLNEAEEPKKPRRKFRSKAERIAAKNKRAIKRLAPHREWATKKLPNIFRTGGVENLSSMDRQEFITMNRSIEKNAVLRSAKSELIRIMSILRPMLKPGVCRLVREYNIIDSFRNSTANADPSTIWEPGHGLAGGIGMAIPRTGWWGVRDWKRADQLDKYKRLYIDNIYFKYIQGVRLLLNEHIPVCRIKDCYEKGHSLFLSNGYCGGFNTDSGEDWTLGRAVQELSEERLADFNMFTKRSRGKVRPEVPEAAEKARQEKLARGEELDWVKDYAEDWRQFFDSDI